MQLWPCDCNIYLCTALLLTPVYPCDSSNMCSYSLALLHQLTRRHTCMLKLATCVIALVVEVTVVEA